MKFEETSLLQNCVIEAKAAGLDLTTDSILHLFEVYTAATSDFLQVVKEKKNPIGLIYEDLKGSMIIAAIVGYEENEEKDMPGNWTYYWTFDSDDIKDVKTYSINSNQVNELFIRRAFDMRHIRFTSSMYISKLGNMFMKLLSDFLDQNAKETEEFVIEHEGYFRASVAVENGEVVKSFVPDGAMKRLIKDDEQASADVA